MKDDARLVTVRDGSRLCHVPGATHLGDRHRMAPRRSQQKAASSKVSLVKLDAATPGSEPKRFDPLTAVLPYPLHEENAANTEDSSNVQV